MEAHFSRLNRCRQSAVAAILALSGFRFAHIHLLWSDEDYHLVAALQILHGRVPYRDFWYDKPPLNAVYYLLIGAHSGWLLRFLDAAYILLACCLVYRLARFWWSEAEGWTAALLLAFFTTFYLPSAVIPFAADALMLAPHLAAIYCAQRKLPLWAGIWAGVGFLVNPKALFVLAVCATWLWRDWPALAGGFALPLAGGFLWARFTGAWPGYIEQVWRWGLIYAKESSLAHPVTNGLLRIMDWLAFHAALVVGAIYVVLRIRRGELWRLAVWLGFSFAAVCVGSRFVPRYFLQLLPPLSVIASCGIVFLFRTRGRLAVALFGVLFAVPLVRFGPRYLSLELDNLSGRKPEWADVAMDLDSQDAAKKLRSLSKPGDTLFVWGYRPDIYVSTRMMPDGVFWDSQPLTGVPADRHLSAETAIYNGPAAANREALIRSHPTWIVDGLGLLNPKLAPGVYPELGSWLQGYELTGRTKFSLIYRRRNSF
jgi:hypothetical protein